MNDFEDKTEGERNSEDDATAEDVHLPQGFYMEDGC